jgi:hypothetical protein
LEYVDGSDPEKAASIGRFTGIVIDVPNLRQFIDSSTRQGVEWISVPVDDGIPRGEFLDFDGNILAAIDMNV